MPAYSDMINKLDKNIMKETVGQINNVLNILNPGNPFPYVPWNQYKYDICSLLKIDMKTIMCIQSTCTMPESSKRGDLTKDKFMS